MIWYYDDPNKIGRGVSDERGPTSSDENTGLEDDGPNTLCPRK